MVRKRKIVPRKDRVLTEAELGVMHALWQIGGGTVQDVQAAICGGEKLAYTTVSTILRILEEKEFVESTESGRKHVYSPAIRRSDYERRAVKHLAARLFQNNSFSMVKHLIAEKDISPDDLAEIRKLIDQLDTKNTSGADHAD